MRFARQEAAYLLCVLAALLFVPFLSDEAAGRFSGFGFGLTPQTMLVICAPTGFAALMGLRIFGFFAADPDRGLFSGSLPAALFATLLVLPTIVIDLASPFPADINVALPDALLFYPAIALVAQTVFFLFPAVVVFGVTRSVWTTILLVSLAEPVFQIWLELVDGVTRRGAFVFLQILAVSLVQMTLFRKHGFFVMLAFRLVYYLHWHILWGQLRLGLLF